MHHKLTLLALLALSVSGCAAITNPVANGIPVRVLPPELLAPSKENKVEVPLRLLRQEPPEVYRLASGDILGVYIEGVLGERDQLPPVNVPVEGDLPPALGFPIPVREDGTVPLPLIPPVNVAGMSITEAEQAIVRAYTVDRQILQRDRERIIVTLMRPRTIRVLVIRQDTPNTAGLNITQTSLFNRRFGGIDVSSSGSTGTGMVVDLPAYQNDVLNALTRTGGLPGLDAVNEVVVQRGAYSGTSPDAFTMQSEQASVRIPLRIDAGSPPPFVPEDVLLHEGDVLYIAGRDAELYYTGGLLPAAELQLPRDFDLDVIEALIRVNGPLVNGGINSNNLSGSIVSSGIGNPSPSNLTIIRRLKDGRQLPILIDVNRALKDPRENILVQSGDILILQETPGEALARYMTNAVNFSFFFDLFETPDAFGDASILVP